MFWSLKQSTSWIKTSMKTLVHSCMIRVKKLNVMLQVLSSEN
jgi:hypothetical protein